MELFKLTIRQSITELEVSLNVEASNYDVAQSLADGLASLMPATEEYFDKNDCMTMAYWSGMAEYEQWNGKE